MRAACGCGACAGNARGCALEPCDHVCSPHVRPNGIIFIIKSYRRRIGTATCATKAHTRVRVARAHSFGRSLARRRCHVHTHEPVISDIAVVRTLHARVARASSTHNARMTALERRRKQQAGNRGACVGKNKQATGARALATIVRTPVRAGAAGGRRARALAQTIGASGGRSMIQMVHGTRGSRRENIRQPNAAAADWHHTYTARRWRRRRR